MKRPVSRPSACNICHTPIPQPARGRPRLTCSDRCRQRKRRRDYTTWTGPRREAQKWSLAERLVRRLERRSGPISDAVPEIRSLYDWGLSPRRRLLIHLARRDYYAEPPPVSHCEVCRSPYLPDFPGATRRYCSKQCRRAAARNRKALREALAAYRDPDLAPAVDPRVWVRERLGLPLKVCADCGKPFPDDFPRQKYCSRICRQRAYRARRRTPRTCAGCGKPLQVRPNQVNRQRYCSRSCWKRADYQRRLPPERQRANRPTHRPCDRCGRDFPLDKFAWSRQRFCSPTCRDLAAAQRKRARRPRGMVSPMP